MTAHRASPSQAAGAAASDLKAVVGARLAPRPRRRPGRPGHQRRRSSSRTSRHVRVAGTRPDRRSAGRAGPTGRRQQCRRRTGRARRSDEASGAVSKSSCAASPTMVRLRSASVGPGDAHPSGHTISKPPTSHARSTQRGKADCRTPRSPERCGAESLGLAHGAARTWVVATVLTGRGSGGQTVGHGAVAVRAVAAVPGVAAP